MSGAVTLNSILSPNEASRLNSGCSKRISTFLEESNPEAFKKSGDLAKLAFNATLACFEILSVNPHWENIPKNPCPALRKEWKALETQLKNLPPEKDQDSVQQPQGPKIIYDKMNAIQDKIKEFKCNLEKTNPQMAKLVRQWDCDKISEIKKRLSAAIQLQREYYDTTWIGSISKFFLKLRGQWNNGDTAVIQSALQFLYKWDFKQPLHNVATESNFKLFDTPPYKLGTNEYAKGPNLQNKDLEQVGNVPWLRTSWIQKHLNTEHLYNEPLSKQITIVNVPAVKTA